MWLCDEGRIETCPQKGVCGLELFQVIDVGSYSKGFYSFDKISLKKDL